MSVEVMRSVIDAAEGRVPVDTLFTNAQIVDVYGQRVAPGSVAVKDGISAAVITAPACSSGSAGTHEGIMYLMEMGARRPSSIIKRRPSRPETLAISWLSAMAVVVPRVAAIRAYSAGRMLDDSMWRCPSIKPGAM